MIQFAAVVLFICITFGQASANGAGKAGQTTSGCGGGGCHGAKSTETTVTVPVPTGGSLNVEPGGTIELMVVVGHPTKAGAGFNVKVTESSSTKAAGTLTAGNGSKVLFSELTHSTRKDFSGGIAEWSFTWKAPSTPGTYLIRAAGNAVDGDGFAGSADVWNIMEPISITVGTSSVFEDVNSSSIIVAPNPSTNGATIEFTLPSAGEIQTTIATMDGKLVWSSQNEHREAGKNEIYWNGKDNNGVSVPTGQYIALVKNGSDYIHVPITVAK